MQEEAARRALEEAKSDPEMLAIMVNTFFKCLFCVSKPCFYTGAVI
jgi:hypothetical protein